MANGPVVANPQCLRTLAVLEFAICAIIWAKTSLGPVNPVHQPAFAIATAAGALHCVPYIGATPLDIYLPS